MPRMRFALFGAIAIVLTLGILSVPESPLTRARYDALPVEERDDYWASCIRAVGGGQHIASSSRWSPHIPRRYGT